MVLTVVWAIKFSYSDCSVIGKIRLGQRMKKIKRVSNQGKPTWGWRDVFDNIGNAIVNDVLFLPLALLPMVVVGWVLFTWGMIWLLFPVLFLIVMLLIWWFKSS